MNSDNPVENGKIISLLLPKNLVQRLNNQIRSKEKLNQFITNAIEHQLSFEEQFTTLEETAVSWHTPDDKEPLPEDEIVSWLNENGRFWHQPKQ